MASPAPLPFRLRLPDGGSIAYGVEGSGAAPLLLLSGLSGQAAFWDAVVPSLVERFTIVLHDHRGTGASSRCDRQYSVATIAADVLALMDHLDIPAAAVIGHSMGGAVGQHLALHAPERLTRLVLSATWARACAYMRRLFTLRRQILDGLGPGAYRRHGELVQAPPWWIAAQPEPADVPPETALGIEIIRRRLDAVLAHDTQDALGRIALPVLVVTAQDDIVVPPAHAAGLARDIPGATLARLPDGGHFVPRVRPDAWLALLRGFLDAERGR
jgi:aminoacrylate hydrolase